MSFCDSCFSQYLNVSLLSNIWVNRCQMPGVHKNYTCLNWSYDVIRHKSRKTSNCLSILFTLKIIELVMSTVIISSCYNLHCLSEIKFGKQNYFCLYSISQEVEWPEQTLPYINQVIIHIPSSWIQTFNQLLNLFMSTRELYYSSHP